RARDLCHRQAGPHPLPPGRADLGRDLGPRAAAPRQAARCVVMGLNDRNALDLSPLPRAGEGRVRAGAARRLSRTLAVAGLPSPRPSPARGRGGRFAGAVVGVLLALNMPALAVPPAERLPDPALEARARALSQELRCLVCQNETIDESNADLAHDLRVLVR